mmetsp:Transcript_18279/g.53267  ORF Transcript_18279/g.53267 Transcript_18279/m.53267 type:complete len:261 (-) Transcript_18279:1087-1869(-)
MPRLPSAKLKPACTSPTAASSRMPACRTTCTSGSTTPRRMHCAPSLSWSSSSSRESRGGGTTALELRQRPTSSSGPTLTGAALFPVRMAASSGRSRLRMTMAGPRQRTALEATARAMRRPGSPIGRGVASAVATAHGSVPKTRSCSTFAWSRPASRCGGLPRSSACPSSQLAAHSSPPWTCWRSSSGPSCTSCPQSACTISSPSVCVRTSNRRARTPPCTQCTSSMPSRSSQRPPSASSREPFCGPVTSTTTPRSSCSAS